MVANISFTSDLNEAAGDADVVIEAILEKLDLKLDLFARLDEICPPHTILATNSSFIISSKIAPVTKRPEKVCNMHFFNPALVMKLVEVVSTIQSSPEAAQIATDLAKSMGKTAIQAKDRAGFVVNLLLVPYLLDAIRAFESGLATREDIDTGMVLGCGHPMGPLTLLDMIGLDTIYSITGIMFDEFKDAKYAAPPLLKQMVKAGFYGRKSGRGFYDYR